MTTAQHYDLREEVANWKAMLDLGALDNLLTYTERQSYRFEFGLMSIALNGATGDDTAQRARNLINEITAIVEAAS